MRRLTVLIVGAALAIPAAAAASPPAAPATATSASAGLTLAARHVNGSVGAIVSDWDWTVHGAIAPYVPGQRITLHVFRNGKRIITTTLAIRRDGDRGTFASSLRIGGVGRISVRAIHYATPAQGLLVSRAYSIWLVARPRSRGRAATRCASSSTT